MSRSPERPPRPLRTRPLRKDRAGSPVGDGVAARLPPPTHEATDTDETTQEVLSWHIESQS